MHITVLDGIEGISQLEDLLKLTGEQYGISYTYLKLEKMDIQPCRNCGGCSTKTPGECLFKDDTPEVMKSLVKSNLVIMATPIRFGGFNSILKKALDKCALLGLPFFKVDKGSLYHPGRYGETMFTSLIIGISRSHSEKQKQSFRQLAKQNAAIMRVPYQAVIVEDNDMLQVKDVILSLLREEQYI